MNNEYDTAKEWPLARRIFFRFFAVYFFLYAIQIITLHPPFVHLWDVPVTWAGKLLVRPEFSIEVWPNGSGDTTFNYLQLFCQLVLSLLISCTWWVADHRRKNYDKVLYWLMVSLRYAVAANMMFYGIFKIFKSQFPFPMLFYLDQPVGQSSPMGLAWSYMGYSTGYNLFIGLAEFACGLFLFFRRTRLFGALLTMAVMSNVVAMNFFYDIPVKLFSSHLFLMAMFIALPDLQRLFSFFFLQQPVPPSSGYQPVYTKKWKRFTHFGVKYGYIIFLIYYIVAAGYNTWQAGGSHNPIPPLYGSYEVLSFSRSSEPMPPLDSNRESWKNIYIEREGLIMVRDEKDWVDGAALLTDTMHHELKWEDPGVKDTIRMHYTIPGKDLLTLNGRIGGDSINIKLKKKDISNYLLMNRGFRWINEYPFNR